MNRPRIFPQQCRRCQSCAINPDHHGREPDTDLDLCDVCYWRERAGSREEGIREAAAYIGDSMEHDRGAGCDLGGNICQEHQDIDGILALIDEEKNDSRL